MDTHSPAEEHRSRPPRRASQNQGSHRGPLRVAALAMGLALLALGLAACSDDDGGVATVPLAEWVAAFEETCVEVITDVEANPDDFDAINERGIAEMRSLPEPDEMADTAADLLDTIGSDQESGLTQAEIDAIDERLMTAFIHLGVSDACIQGVPG